MVYPELEQKLEASKLAMTSATSQTIIEQCKAYLGLLSEYRSQLYELEVPARTEDLVDRKAIREAIETTTSERNRTQVLLLSFTTVSGYEAVEIFNDRKYQGHDDWELQSSGVKFRGGDNGDLITIQEAVDRASLIRRDDYVAKTSAERLSIETKPNNESIVNNAVRESPGEE